MRRRFPVLIALRPARVSLRWLVLAAVWDPPVRALSLYEEAAGRKKGDARHRAKLCGECRIFGQ